MGKASFSVDKVTQNTDIHTQRLNGFSCAIIVNCSNNYFKKFYEYDEFLSKAQNIYKEKIKQNMQKSAIFNLFQEAIISINEDHQEDDIIDLFFELKQKFGGHELINLTIHKDEGYFQKDGRNYYPNKNILKKGNDWFITSDSSNGKKNEDFTILVNINEFNKVLTPHAHAIFSMFDFKLGRNARMQKKDMVERLKFVAQILKMDYAPQKISNTINNLNEEDLKNLDNQINIRNQNLLDINTQVASKEIELEELSLKLAEQYHALNDIVNRIKQKENDLDDLISQVLIKEDILDSLNNTISLKGTTVTSLETQIKQKEFRLDELNHKIDIKMQGIAI
ncbi:coiled-coil domain-containing protein [Aliarcobacter lanthieri]|uniref:coiled-coil domain-containing protein n=1 Tax=Aliarcobacter lanthieri TaxID=1355374 RepID=UPI003AAB511C